MPGFAVEGDISLNAAGTDFFLVDGLLAIRSRIDAGTHVVQGYWPYDKNAGIDYFGRVFGKGVTAQQIRDVFAEFLRSVEGVLEVVSIIVEIEPETRTALVNWTVRCDDGTLSGSSPFEVTQ